VPAKWSEASDDQGVGRSVELSRWWTTFQDPVLDSLVDRAVRSNLDLRVAEVRIQEARAARGVRAADEWPQVDVSSSYSRSRRSDAVPPFNSSGLPDNLFGNRTQDLYQAGFDARWELDVFGGVRRDIEAATAEIAAVEENRRDVLITLLAEVARNYVELRGFQRQLAITNENLAVQRETLELTRVRFQAGLASDLDVARAEAQVATTQSQIPTLERSAKQAIHRLGVLLGQEPGALLSELSPEAPIPPTPPEVPVGLPSDLLRRRPDVRRAERELAAATARIGVAKADLFPRFSLTGSFGRRSDQFSDLSQGASLFWGIGPSVRWPIFTAGRILANIRVQNARQEQALALYEKAVLTSLEDVENALVAYSREQARRASLAEAVAANRRAVELANTLYFSGLEDFLAVLDAQRSLYASQDQLVQSERALVVNLIALYKALGGGWEQ
jgi:NodT family efflux transporter outer membrane factor (OMF) lipoprotein